MLRLERKLLNLPDCGPEARLGHLRGMLQTAIELEHSTIPPYLYALYSIKDERNCEAAGLIKSIVLEEMLHMSLDCNVLNAIGGSPAIDNPQFIPTYPGHLPGGVENGLIVGLAPLSKQLVNDVFMVIEAPPTGNSQIDGTVPHDEGITIGEFYDAIKHYMQVVEAEYQTMGKTIFTGHIGPDGKTEFRQLLTGFTALQGAGITGLKSALDAIDLIVSQGEGSSRSPLDQDHELAHYYKFSELYYGKRLIKNPVSNEPPWVFQGHRIGFDPAGVQPVVINPSTGLYAGQPKLADLNYYFNLGYSRLLRNLHRVFNGQPDWLGPALLGMQALKEQAQFMMAQEIVPGQTAGPTFEYILEP